ncbi:MBL fold metallo-hydrolase [Austwickia chelonae]|uniref:MBL fold metallo-hydrolase n=1 Tax=Austwickia chelonae TaxID=100225 RepID=UPI000E22416B|nr:MBL fold metallo-hydrolase [Austwickia chelonae]
MIFTQYYLDCLSQASYLIADETSRKAVIVDPRRDIDDYLTDTRDADLDIIGIINTHFHADFVSGHLELARATGAWIGYGHHATPEFDIRPLHHGDRIDLGDLQLDILETPGHTPESISILVHEHADDPTPYGVLTGDALFIGDVGRPDLLASEGNTADELARKLYHSIQKTLMGLPDEVRVFPAHGAGSACGKNLSTEKQSTIGEQRRTNYACAPMSEDDFVAIVTEGQPAAPAYFSFDATLNKQQRPVLDPHATIPALTDEQIDNALADGAVVHDARPAPDYTAGHLQGSVSVPTDGRMAETAGMLFAPRQRFVLATPEGLEQDTAMRLSRIGYDQVIGYIPQIEEYLARHAAHVAHAAKVPADHTDQLGADTQLLDIRNPGEVAQGMIPGANHIPLPQLAERHHELDPTRPTVVYCAGGWRSHVGASYLRSRGFTDVADITGGYNAWAAEHQKA